MVPALRLVAAAAALLGVEGAALVVSVPTGTEREAWVMGTRVRISVDSESSEEGAKVSEEVLREVERIESLLSTWDPASALSRVNRAPVGQPTPGPRELVELLVEVEARANMTARAFEPAIGALVDAWDLRGAGRAAGVGELTAALASTGAVAFAYDAEAGVVRRNREQAWIDAGGFGKGAALRSVARMLRHRSDEDSRWAYAAVVDLGGQLWVSPNRAEPLLVEVAHPARRDVSVATVALAGASVATSGHSERPGHLLDPRTGRPTEAWGTVTVVSEDPLEADVLSTALHVMGPDRGPDWAEAHGVAALFAVRTGDCELRATPAMARWLTEKGRPC